MNNRMFSANGQIIFGISLLLCSLFSFALAPNWLILVALLLLALINITNGWKRKQREK
ncbi:hypothetical protein [Lactobacillus sp. Sy-1]|uniref:hypothetical protein n=1 Tax=Lactobacillus sp. Sy-1 TaxID=2109645 RepID=UPI001C5B8BE7|nr:hypothetical protein [Lactobacillus sp. Sy-1]MBW1606401.1 hypothetical protein [Lactobacillus sp. Sy-1]